MIQKNYTTGRLTLNEINLRDAEFIFELVNTAGWLQFIGDRNIKTTADASAYIQKLIDNPNTTYLVVRLLDLQIPVGAISFIKRDHLEYNDIGFAFLPHYMGKGYAYEAAVAVLTEAIKDHPTIVAISIEENKSSVRLLEKLGFSYTKKIKSGDEKLHLYTVTDDKIYIDQLVKDFFGIFSNSNGKQPNWAIINKTCIPEAIIIKKQGTEEFVYNLDSFIAPRQKILTDGTLIDFEERETNSATTIIGNIAQRNSKYQKSGYLKGTYFKEHGNKFFQFIKTINGWKINSLIWEDETVK
jgi:RimJ/RimL family protein N-acetyltransferase